MAEYRLHCFGESGNAYKCALMLSLTGADWEPVFVDFFNGETRGAAFRSLNPMGEVPVLEHKGEVVTQSGAILDYISALTGDYDPGPENAREAWRWMLFDSQKLSGMLGPWRFLARLAPEKLRNPDVIAFLEGRARNALKVLDGHLGARDWIAADGPTIADMMCAGYVFYEGEYPIDWPADYPAVHAWKERLRALDGWAAPYDLMPRGSD